MTVQDVVYLMEAGMLAPLFLLGLRSVVLWCWSLMKREAVG